MEELLASLPPEVKKHVEYLYSNHRSRMQQQQQQLPAVAAGDMPERGSEAGGSDLHSADAKVPVSALRQDMKAPAHRSVKNGGEQEAVASVPSQHPQDARAEGQEIQRASASLAWYDRLKGREEWQGEGGGRQERRSQGLRETGFGVPDDSEGLMGRRARESISRMAAVVEQQHKLLLSNSASLRQVLGELRGMREERAQERRERKDFLEEVRRVRETWTQDKTAHDEEAAKFHRVQAQEGHVGDRSPTEQDSVSHSGYLVTI